MAVQNAFASQDVATNISQGFVNTGTANAPLDLASALTYSVMNPNYSDISTASVGANADNGTTSPTNTNLGSIAQQLGVTLSSATTNSLTLADGSVLSGNPLSAYNQALAQNGGDVGSARDAALGAAIAEKVTDLRSQIATGVAEGKSVYIVWVNVSAQGISARFSDKTIVNSISYRIWKVNVSATNGRKVNLSANFHCFSPISHSSLFQKNRTLN